MRGQPVRIGPWTGGMNTRDLQGEIADNELTLAQNVILDSKGVAYFRPPIMNLGMLGLSTPSTNRFIRMLGTYNLGPGQLNATRFMIQDGQNVAGSAIRYLDVVPGQAFNGTQSWQSAFAGASPGKTYTSMVEYNGKLYFINGDSAGGFSCPVGTALTTMTAVPNIPAGNNALVHKDRLFVLTDSTIYWSKATDFSNFTAPEGGFVDIVGPLGSGAIDFFVVGNAIYILHKTGVFTLNFYDDPAVDGTLQKVANISIVCGTTYNNRVFVFDGRVVFEFSSGNLIPISEKINFSINPMQGDTVPVGWVTVAHMFAIGGFLLLTSTPLEFRQPMAYAYNLDNGTWTMWSGANDSESRDNWPTSAMLKDDTDKFAIFSGGFDTNGHIVALDFNYVYGGFDTLQSGDWQRQGCVDISLFSNTTPTYYARRVRLITKRYGLGDAGRGKRLFLLRSFAELIPINTGSHSHVPTWNVTIDSRDDDKNSPYGNRVSSTLPDNAKYVDIPLNIRFGSFSLAYIAEGGTISTLAQRSFGIVPGVEVYLRAGAEERVR